jgi:hypothetical protein
LTVPAKTKVPGLSTARLVTAAHAREADMGELEKAALIFLNEIEKHDSEAVELLKDVVGNLQKVISSLEKPKKWKFNIDRNFQTGRIQEVTAEQID